jgi:UDP-3-O-[3-hydroxymyristoyl] N-acetylglucosamine deacetylase / 3-hydroxyacyl-[acyl-carrier-protein] dehydratase
MLDNQKTIKKSYNFVGKGLHTGLQVNMTLLPSNPNTGIRFLRKDISNDSYIEAVADYVTYTERGTTLEKGEIRVSTIEHLLATFVGMGVDNAIVELNAPEAPILDGSAKPYVEAISKDGLEDQGVPRKYFVIKDRIDYKDPKSGAELTILPSDDYSIDVTIDYNSKVLGVQTAAFSKEVDFAKDIAPCRTFVFFHELEFLFKHNLIKGGDLENAIVIVEHPVPQEELDRMAALFNVSSIKRVPEGYLSNISLRFENECARHKLLDVIGDFALIGFRMKAKVVANKSGHGINTSVAKIIREKALKNN